MKKFPLFNENKLKLTSYRKRKTPQTHALGSLAKAARQTDLRNIVMGKIRETRRLIRKTADKVRSVFSVFFKAKVV